MKLTFGGGINELNDISIPATDAISGQNFDLGTGNTKFKPRKPFDLLGTTPNASNIHGIHQLIKKDNSKTTIVASGDTMYSWTGSAFTSVGTISALSELHDYYWPLDDVSLIVDRKLLEPVKEWNGVTLVDLAHNIAGTTTLNAKYGAVLNGRAVLANIKTDSVLNPHMIVMSEFENRQNFDTSSRSGDSGFSTGDEPFYLLTPDLKPINGLVVFKDLLICSTENGQLFKLTGDDSTNYRWDSFYSGSSAVGLNSIANIGNDVYFMRQGGVIESLRSTNTYGDVGTDDISIYVREILRNSNGVRIVYDQTYRKVFFFMEDRCLVLFKDLLGQQTSPFVIYRTTLDSNLLTDSARYMELPYNQDKTVLFGDALGNIFDINGTGVGDGGTKDIITTRSLPLQTFDYKRFLRGRVNYRRIGTCQLNIQLDWGDEKSITNFTVPLKGTANLDSKYYRTNSQNYYNSGTATADDIYYSEGIIATANPVSQGFSVSGKGSTVFATMSVETSENFEIDYLEI